MSTIIVAAVLVGIVAAICFLVVHLDKKQKRSAMNRLLFAFHKAGSEHNLTFSSQEMLNDSIIGLDGVHRKLLVLERTAHGVFNSFVIDLNEVKSCLVKKAYGTTGGSSQEGARPEQYLQSISLHFTLADDPPADVFFYKHFENNIYQMAELESKAKHWEDILKKMFAPMKKAA